MRYAIVIEKTDTNFAAYVPDLPGCIATGATIEETEQSIQAAIKFISTACAKMVFPFPRQAAKWSTLKSPLENKHRPP